VAPLRLVPVRRTLPRKLQSGLAAFLILAALHGQSIAAISGPEYREATLKSIDVLSSHLILLQAQALHDQILNNISYTIRFAPADLRLNDDSIHSGSFVRSLLPSSVGYGTVSGLGAFIGLQGDYIKVFDLTDKDEKDQTTNGELQAVGAEVSQVIAFAGISLLGFQLDAGIMGGAGFRLDKDGEFAQNRSQLVKDTSVLSDKPRFVYTAYHKSGVYLSTIFGIDPVSHERALSDFKLNVQPLEQYLPEFYGLPFLDIVSYTPIAAYYQKYLVTDTSGGNAKSVPKSSRDYDFSYGSDNFLTQGFRPSMTLKVRPHMAFRQVDAAYVKNWGDILILGGRGAYYLKGGESNVSVDAFAMLSLGLTFGFSYSYNSPDNVTFLPLSGLHVFGVQVIWGARETAKMLFPFSPALTRK